MAPGASSRARRSRAGARSSSTRRPARATSIPYRRARPQQVPKDGRAFPAQAASIATMSERTSYEPGVPSWVDLSSPDTDASATFYGGLFGWELQSAGPVEETGGYGMFTIEGQAGRRRRADHAGGPAAGVVGVRRHRRRGRRRRSARTSAGGTSLVEPMDVMDAGGWRSSPTPPAGCRRLAGRPPHRRRARQRARRAQLERAADARRRGREGVLRRRLRWKPDDQDFGGMTYTLFNVGGHSVSRARCPRRPRSPTRCRPSG